MRRNAGYIASVTPLCEHRHATTREQPIGRAPPAHDQPTGRHRPAHDHRPAEWLGGEGSAL
jgi:hypothetical protein